MTPFTSDFAFIPSAEKQKELLGPDTNDPARRKLRKGQSWITEELRRFITERESFYMASLNEAGRIYVQQRGGPKGFLKVLDKHTLAFADYRKNNTHPYGEDETVSRRVHLFLTDRPNNTRIKIWGEAEVLNPTGPFLDMVQHEEYHTHIVRIIKVRISDWELKGRFPSSLIRRLEEIGSDLKRLMSRIQEVKKQLGG